MKSIAVVIVHFGNKKDTFECLDSLEKCSVKHVSITVYLVDNDPANRLSYSELNYKFPIILFVTKKNLGYAGGFNIGIKKALKKRHYALLMLSNDVVVKKNLLSKQLSYMEKGVAQLVSPIITYYDKPDIIWCMNGHLNTFFLFARYPNMNKKLKEVVLTKPIVSEFAAACLMVNMTVFKKIGLLDERYFLNAEDVEWCFRAKKAGYRLIYMPFALALHKVSAGAGIRGTNLLTPINAYFYARNFFIILRDHAKDLNIFTGFIGQTFIRLPFYVCMRMASFKAASYYLRGYRDGIRYLITGKLVNSL